ncbi:MAG: hypothetical protein ACXWX5_12000, partial [Actinomycetota bacterium]
GVGRTTNVERRKIGQRIDPHLRVIGFVLGMGLAASVVAASRIPAGAGVLGADVHMVVAPTGELAVKPSGIVLTGTGLTPGADPVTGTLQVLNQTGSVLDVYLRGIADAPGLDRTLWISVTAPDDEKVYRGALGGFRDWSAVGVTLRPGAWGTFRFEAWVPSDAGPGYAGKLAQVDLGFRVKEEAVP